MKYFRRQMFDVELDHKSFKKSPITQLPAFMVGSVQGDIHGIEQLLVDLNTNAHFGWPTDIDIEYLWDFVMIRNIDQNNPTVDIYAIPRTNDRKLSASPYGYYYITDGKLKDMVKRWHSSQGVISTYIEGWLAGKYSRK